MCFPFLTFPIHKIPFLLLYHLPIRQSISSLQTFSFARVTLSFTRFILPASFPSPIFPVPFFFHLSWHSFHSSLSSLCLTCRLYPLSFCVLCLRPPLFQTVPSSFFHAFLLLFPLNPSLLSFPQFFLTATVNPTPHFPLTTIFWSLTLFC